MADRRPEPATPRPAATVVLVRPGSGGLEVLLTLRPPSMAFAGDMHVFPGGAVDAADSDPRLARRSPLAAREAAIGLGMDPSRDPAAEDARRFHIAAVRELFEEAGVLLADRGDGRPIDPDALVAARDRLNRGEVTLLDVAAVLDLRLRLDWLAPISHWTTPPIMARRFDTRFFVAELPTGTDPTFTTGEVAGHQWLTPTAALDAMATGEIQLWPPTSATLQQLEHVRSLAEIRERLAAGPLAAPRAVVESPDLERIVLGGAGGVPGQTVNSYLVGRRELVVVDPGDPSDAAADAILDAASRRGGRIAAIALTHVDPDHAGGAEPLALRLGVDVFVGPGGGRYLPGETMAIEDGDEVAAGDVALGVITTPGPRPDHVAFAVGSDILVGDLLGGRGSRSVLRAPDEAAWHRSLVGVAGMRPGRLFPGHGEPLSRSALAEAVSEAATPPGSGGS